LVFSDNYFIIKFENKPELSLIKSSGESREFLKKSSVIKPAKKFFNQGGRGLYPLSWKLSLSLTYIESRYGLVLLSTGGKMVIKKRAAHLIDALARNRNYS